jgi:hypothetical protein
MQTDPFPNLPSYDDPWARLNEAFQEILDTKTKSSDIKVMQELVEFTHEMSAAEKKEYND